MGNELAMSNLLRSERIIVPLEDDDYADAVGRLADTLEEAGVVADREELDVLIQAEATSGDIPTLGERVLLAHYRTDAVEELVFALGTAPEAFAFNPPNAPEARVLVLIVGPPSAARYYLKMIAGLSRWLRNEDVVAELERAASPEDVLKTLRTLRDLVIEPEMLVQDLMSREVQAVSPETPLSEVLRLMVRHNRRAVPIVNDVREVLGLVTDRELLEHFLPQLLSPGTIDSEGEPSLDDIEVREVMQRSVMCLSEDQLISDVMGMMVGKDVARFPVVREGKLTGFLSRTDLIRKLLEPYV